MRGEVGYKYASASNDITQLRLNETREKLLLNMYIHLTIRAEVKCLRLGRRTHGRTPSLIFYIYKKKLYKTLQAACAGCSSKIVFVPNKLQPIPRQVIAAGDQQGVNAVKVNSYPLVTFL